MNKNISTLEFIGEWNNILLYDLYFWYKKDVNVYLEKYFGEKRKIGIFIVANKEYIYVDKSYYEQLETNINTLPPELLLRNIKNFYPLFSEIKGQLIKRQNAVVDNLTDQELIDELFLVISLVNKITPFDQYSMIGERFYLERFEKYLKEQLRKIGQEDKFIEYRTILATPIKLSSTQEEELSLLTIALKMRERLDEEVVDKLIKEHVFNYGWLPVFLFAPPWDGKYIKSEAGKLAKEGDLVKRRQGLIDYGKIQTAKIATIMNDMPEQTLWPEIFRELSYIRNEAETMVSLGSSVLRPVYKEIYRRTGLEERDIRYLSPEEIARAVLTKTIDQQLLAKRKQACILLSDTTEELIVDGEECLRMFKSIYKREEKLSDGSLKGVPASLGKAVGKVRIIKSVDDIKNFEKGDILVSESTCIDYVPIMRIAGAVLTDNGGITSHAALVSRELHIPAIVGVHNVHLILKDGDMVEVDAEKGVVKKIKGCVY